MKSMHFPVPSDITERHVDVLGTPFLPFIQVLLHQDEDYCTANEDYPKCIYLFHFLLVTFEHTFQTNKINAWIYFHRYKRKAFEAHSTCLAACNGIHTSSGKHQKYSTELDKSKWLLSLQRSCW